MSHGPDIRSAQGAEQALRTRYDVVRNKLVPSFLERHRMTVVALAELIQVDRSSLNRFLNGVEGYTPTPKRKGKLEMLEKLEALCSQLTIRPNVDRLLTHGDTSGRADGDYDVWFRNFCQRIYSLGEKYDPATSLVLLPEFRAQAMSAPPPYATSMSVNLLGVVVGIVDPRGNPGISSTLAAETIDRIKMLEEFALENASDNYRKDRIHKPIGYAGFTLAALALHVGDEPLLEEAMDRLVRASFMPHEVTDGHSLNLLMVLEALFERGHPRAALLSEQVAREAEQKGAERLTAAQAMLSCPLVLEHWTVVAPALTKLFAEADRDELEADR